MLCRFNRVEKLALVGIIENILQPKGNNKQKELLSVSNYLYKYGINNFNELRKEFLDEYNSSKNLEDLLKNVNRDNYKFFVDIVLRTAMSAGELNPRELSIMDLLSKTWKINSRVLLYTH
jgi:hypothetical protein